jgi:hypothetical protein
MPLIFSIMSTSVVGKSMKGRKERIKITSEFYNSLQITIHKNNQI